MDNREKFEYWLDIAQFDLGSATAMFNTGRWLYVVFMCHQAIEKLVKGLYILHVDDNVPRIHNIAELLKKFENKLSTHIDQEIYTFFYDLSRYYIVVRYPDYKNKLSTYLNKEKVEPILTKTREVFTWLLTLKP
jgi:HEPN domain-containing protein